MASAAEVLAKRKTVVSKTTTVLSTPPVTVVSKPTATSNTSVPVSTNWTPPPRVCSYTSRALNAEIFLGNNTSFKFAGNYYTTEKSVEIHELDSLCKRQPNVFTKVS